MLGKQENFSITAIDLIPFTFVPEREVRLSMQILLLMGSQISLIWTTAFLEQHEIIIKQLMDYGVKLTLKGGKQNLIS